MEAQVVAGALRMESGWASGVVVGQEGEGRRGRNGCCCSAQAASSSLSMSLRHSSRVQRHSGSLRFSCHGSSDSGCSHRWESAHVDYGRSRQSSPVSRSDPWGCGSRWVGLSVKMGGAVEKRPHTKIRGAVDLYGPLWGSRWVGRWYPCGRFCLRLPQTHLGSVRGKMEGKVRAGVVRCALADAVVLRHVGEEVILQKIAEEFGRCEDNKDKMRLLLHYAERLPRLDKEDCIPENQVMGCTARVWVTARLDDEGRVWFSGDSDAELSRGLCAVLVEGLSGLTPEAILDVREETLTSMHLSPIATRSRINGFYNMLKMMQKRAGELALVRDGLTPVAPFPSILISANGELQPRGDFAQSQARFLSPDPDAVDTLVSLISSKKIGVVAHFYMDPEVQGVLAAARSRWPHILISDSLVMADGAVKMAEAGCTTIAVLGVDFMSENVRAILDQAGFSHVGVYRMSNLEIGCSLATAAQGPSYVQFLDEASKTPNSLHVIYINTSLETKAEAQLKVPTITCTSSNVVQTILQASAQVPEVSVWYGPDTYMGANLAFVLREMANLSDEEIAAIHPAHNRETIGALLTRFHYFQDGACIVHDIFGSEVVKRVKAGYSDAYQTAHFEVPGEMFALAMEAKHRQMGVVGSTSNILSFIAEKTQEAIARGHDQRLQFVLGTESGMITSIVGKVREILKRNMEAAAGASGPPPQVDVEIVFPVSSDAITASPEATGGNLSSPSLSAPAGQGLDLLKGAVRPASGVIGELGVVPGVQAGEGCSISGGCASCPYMKMNSLNALLRVCQWIGTDSEAMLSAYKPRLVRDQVGGRSLVDLGCTPILHMRHFQKTGTFADNFVDDIRARKSSSS